MPTLTRILPIRIATATLLLSLLLPLTSRAEPEIIQERIESEEETFRLVKVLGDLHHPWSIAFLPDDRLLITERRGRLLLFDNGQRTEIQGLPPIADGGQGGLMDVVLHPEHPQNGWIYLSYSAPGEGGRGTDLARARLDGNQLADFELLFSMQPKTGGGRHMGSRILFDNDGYLYLTLGDRGRRHNAQDLSNHLGTTLRLHDDGSVPDNNPFVDRDDAQPEIYTYGHRNAQGMDLHPDTGDVWLHEHGPQGGDEINLIRAGRNYGWPVTTHGEEYGGGVIGETPPTEGMEPPILHWTPSIAPSGMTFYSSENFPNWQGNIFAGALRAQHLRRVVLLDGQPVHQEVLLRRTIGRIRDVREGPDGNLWILTDQPDGALYRIEPL